MAARVISVFSTEKDAEIFAEKLRQGNRHTNISPVVKREGLTVSDHTIHPPKTAIDKDGNPDLYIVEADTKA